MWSYVKPALIFVIVIACLIGTAAMVLTYYRNKYISEAQKVPIFNRYGN